MEGSWTWGQGCTHVPRVFAFPLALRRFQKRDSFPKAQVGVLRPAPGKEGEPAFHLRMKLKVARAWFRRFPAEAAHRGPQRLWRDVNPSLLAWAPREHLALGDPWHSGNLGRPGGPVEWGDN